MSPATVNRGPARTKRTRAQPPANGMSEYEWLCAHPAVVRKHAGEWIAIYGQKVIAHGKDGDEVIQDAQHVTPDYVFAYIEDDDEDLVL